MQRAEAAGRWWRGWLAARRRNVAAGAAVWAVLGRRRGSVDDSECDGEDGGGYEWCPLRGRTARASGHIKFADCAADRAAPQLFSGGSSFVGSQ